MTDFANPHRLTPKRSYGGCLLALIAASLLLLALAQNYYLSRCMDYSGDGVVLTVRGVYRRADMRSPVEAYSVYKPLRELDAMRKPVGPEKDT